jgi:cellulose synthase/poly-beta-1,6-N-acetylglucosamine synthase-like glycosyltransferase
VIRYPFVSIVVPVRNREQTIGWCLESLTNLDYPGYEVIVVDDHSSDRTREIVRTFPVRLVKVEFVNQYAARNAGIGQSKGEIVAFTDSDCLVVRDWLKNLVGAYQDARIGGVGGKLISCRGTRATEVFLGMGILDFMTPEGGLVLRRKNRFMSGLTGSANMSYRKQILLELNGFDESYPTCGDYDLCRRVQQKHYRLLYEPRAVVRHRHRSNLSGLIIQFFLYGCGQALLFKRQNQGISYVRIKSYFLETMEKEFHFPGISVFFNFDFLIFSSLFFMMALIIPFSLKIGMILLAAVLLGAAFKSIPVAKKMKNLKWILLYPALHLIRNVAFSLGRIAGGIRYRVFFF